MFWPLLCTKSFYKTHESPNIHLAETEYNSVIGQYPLDSWDPRRKCQLQRILWFFYSKSGTNKYWKICSSILSEDRISRNNYRLTENDPVIAPRGGNSNYRAMSNVSFKRSGFIEKSLDQSGNCSPSNLILLHFSQRQHIVEFSIHQSLIARVCPSSAVKTIVLVEQQPKTGQWKVYSCFETSHDTIKYTSKKGWDSWPKLEAKDHLNVTRLPVTFGWNMLKRSD